MSALKARKYGIKTQIATLIGQIMRNKRAGEIFCISVKSKRKGGKEPANQMVHPGSEFQAFTFLCRLYEALVTSVYFMIALLRRNFGPKKQADSD